MTNQPTRRKGSPPAGASATVVEAPGFLVTSSAVRAELLMLLYGNAFLVQSR